MKKVILSVLLVIGLLWLVGCTSQSSQNDHGNSQVTQAQPSNPSNPENHEQTQIENKGNNQKQNNEQEQESHNQEGEGGELEDLDTMSWAMLRAMNQPVKCTFEYNNKDSPDESYSGVVYMKGDNTRLEITFKVEGKDMTMVQITKGDTLYINADTLIKEMYGEEQADELDCEWIKFTSASEYQGNEAVTDYDDIEEEVHNPTQPENVKYHCEVGTFGDDKFEIKGKVCSFDQLLGMTGMTQNMPNMPNMPNAPQ